MAVAVARCRWRKRRKRGANRTWPGRPSAQPTRTNRGGQRAGAPSPRYRSRKAARTPVGAAFVLGVGARGTPTSTQLALSSILALVVGRDRLKRPGPVSARLFRRHRPDVVHDVAAHPTGAVSVELREDRWALALRTALVSLHRLALDAGLLSPVYSRWGLAPATESRGAHSAQPRRTIGAGVEQGDAQWAVAVWASPS